MDIPRKAIDELKNIYKEEFAKDLSEKEGYEIAHGLLSRFSIILRPMPEEKPEPKKRAEKGTAPAFLSQRFYLPSTTVQSETTAGSWSRQISTA